jgi:hypothetical protein
MRTAASRSSIPHKQPGLQLLLAQLGRMSVPVEQIHNRPATAEGPQD